MSILDPKGTADAAERTSSQLFLSNIASLVKQPFSPSLFPSGKGCKSVPPTQKNGIPRL